jgi:hypothetical protein
VDNPAHPFPRSATLPYRGPEPGTGSWKDARTRYQAPLARANATPPLSR